MTKIECYISLQCGSEGALRNNISLTLSLEGVEADVVFRRIDDETAAGLGLRGSPSVFINGTEVQPLLARGFS
jgi:hypothetical protein